MLPYMTKLNLRGSMTCPADALKHESGWSNAGWQLTHDTAQNGERQEDLDAKGAAPGHDLQAAELKVAGRLSRSEWSACRCCSARSQACSQSIAAFSNSLCAQCGVPALTRESKPAVASSSMSVVLKTGYSQVLHSKHMFNCSHGQQPAFQLGHKAETPPELRNAADTERWGFVEDLGKVLQTGSREQR